jgi:hypothetical protein
MVQNQLSGLLADARLFGAVAALVTTGATTGLVLRAGVAIYNIAVVARLRNFVLLSVFLDEAFALAPGMLVPPLSAVVTYLGLAIVVALAQRSDLVRE